MISMEGVLAEEPRKMRIGDDVEITDPLSARKGERGKIEERRRFIGLPLGVRMKDGAMMWCHQKELKRI